MGSIGCEPVRWVGMGVLRVWEVRIGRRAVAEVRCIVSTGVWECDDSNGHGNIAPQRSMYCLYR